MLPSPNGVHVAFNQSSAGKMPGHSMFGSERDNWGLVFLNIDSPQKLNLYCFISGCCIYNAKDTMPSVNFSYS